MRLRTWKKLCEKALRWRARKKLQITYAKCLSNTTTIGLKRFFLIILVQGPVSSFPVISIRRKVTVPA
jgi:hypothetical protein